MISFIRLRIFLNLGDNWQDIKDEHGHHLVIGEFHFTKREVEGFTVSNERQDVFAAMELSAKLLLEEHSVHNSYSKISDSLMKLIKKTSSPRPDNAPTNNNSFGRVNKKFIRFFIDMLSLQMVFDNWYVSIRILEFNKILHNLNFSLKFLKNLRYPFAAQVAPLPFSKSTPIEVANALQHNQSIFVSLTVHMNPRSQAFYMENGNLGLSVPSLKQLFSSTVTYKKKFQKGIISSWEGYKDNYVSLSIFMQLILIYDFV
jgi:hypothetical protein